MAPPDVDLVEMADSAVARCDGDVAELYVHVVFGLDKLSAEDLAGSEFEGANVAL